MYTAICVHWQYRAGALAAQAKKHRYRRTRNSISKHKASVSYTDIEGAFVEIEKSLVSGCNGIEVLNFDIDVSSVSYCVDIEVPGFDIEDSSILYWFEIECYNLRYRRFSDLRHSILYQFECQNFRYRVVISYPISTVVFLPSISKVAAPPISQYKDIEGPTFDIEARQGSRCRVGPFEYTACSP